MTVRVCAWCRRWLGLAWWRPLLRVRVTHGICADCSGRLRARLRKGA